MLVAWIFYETVDNNLHINMDTVNIQSTICTATRKITVRLPAGWTLTKAVIKQALGLLSHQCHTRTITNHAVHIEKGPSITDSHLTEQRCVHWPCTESEGCLHRETPDSGWPSVHTDPSTSPPPARGWSATSSQPAPSAPWGCRMIAPSHWLSPASQDRKTETVRWIWALTSSQKDNFSWILFFEYIIVDSWHNRSKNTSEGTWECKQDPNHFLCTDI